VYYRPEQVFCVFDYETFSEANLKKTGIHEYAKHKSTEILCASWRIGLWAELRKRPVIRYSPHIKETSPSGLVKAIQNKEIILVAHNAGFERAITLYVLSRLFPYLNFEELLPPSRFHCTAAQSAALGLPRALEPLCEAVKLAFKKDVVGYKLMLKLSKPRKPTKNNPATRHLERKDILRLMEYCDTDVLADTEVFLTLPHLPPSEQALWELDQEINCRGFAIDTEMVDAVLELVAQEKKLLHAETVKITKGQIDTTNQTAALLNWLKWRGVYLPNLQAKTIKDALQAGLVEGDERRILEIRQAVSKTSIGKYAQFKARSRVDGRCRDGLRFNGAHTGRWTGQGLQPHNFPQGRGIPDFDFAAKIIKERDLELVRMLYGDPITFFSNCLRAVIMAPKGKKLFVGDWAGIELRLVFWFAGHTEGLDAIREGRNLYIELAWVIYNNNKLAKEKNPKEYDVGKRALLGAGFGMGGDKFQATCIQYGQEIENSIAHKAIKTYRRVHSPVPELWANLEKAAISAVRNPNKTFKTNKTEWTFDKRFLWCRLPSGRKLAYYGPEVRYTPDNWGNKRPALYYWGVDSMTKRWVFSKSWGGELTENVVQATARDCMAETLYPLENRNLLPVLTVHDEILSEVETRESKQTFDSLLGKNPSWAKDLPIKVETFEDLRYHK
jgi:DNA polymerase